MGKDDVGEECYEEVIEGGGGGLGVSVEEVEGCMKKQLQN